MCDIQLILTLSNVPLQRDFVLINAKFSSMQIILLEDDAVYEL